MAARIAASLATLRDQINAAYPQRSKVSDGWIGDPAHASRKSDHNPNGAGVVQALDITHDPAKGPDTWKLAETLRQNKDPRIKYVISNGRIFSSQSSPWTWRPYTGANKHAHHIHVSVNDSPALYDSKYLWKLDAQVGIPAAPVVAPPAGITADMRRRMAKLIIDWEARKDKNGHLAVYRPVDGSFEVAGINSVHHPALATKLQGLVQAGDHAAVDRLVQDFILDFTKDAAGWTTDAGVEFYLRDCIFNRGAKGGARILQRAVGVPDDGEVGQMTRAAMARTTDLLTKLRAAREKYERDVLKRNEGDARWKGLVNRWNNSLAAALKFQKEGQGPVGGAVAKNVTTGGIGTGTIGAAVGFSKKSEAEGGGFDWGLMIPILVVGLSLAAVTWFVWPKDETA